MPPCQPSQAPRISYQTSSALRPLPAERRDAILLDAPTRAMHDIVYQRHADLFDHVEVGPPPPTLEDPSGSATITFWNVERGRFPDQQAALLQAQNAAAHLLCELDLGMARTGQRHTTRDLARRLDCTYAYAVEFLELEHGNAQEKRDHAGERNEAGLHGAALLSRHPLGRPALVRLRWDGAWFDGERGERRVGSRIAVFGTLKVDEQPVTLASVHLESHSDPEARAEETRVLLDALDAYAPGQPALIGGDFNTSTLARTWSKGGGKRPVLSEQRVMNPEPFEPLFDLMAGRGFEWQQANDRSAPTQRWHPDDDKTGPLGKIDWFFCRGLDVFGAKTMPAVDTEGRTLSDHELLVVTIKPKPAP